MPDRDSTYAKLADKHLGAPSDRADGKYDMAKTEYGQIEVLRGIGYALLAIREDAGRQSGELADMVHRVADMVGDLQVPADRIADAVESPRRWFPRRRRPSLPPGPAVLSAAGMTTLRTALTSLDAVAGDLEALAASGPALLSAPEVATVRQALADAIKHRMPPGPPVDWYDGEDERLANEYLAILAGLGGAL